MRSSTLSATAVLLSALSLVNGQTFTTCNPTNTTCPSDPGFGSSILFTDFSKGASTDWTALPGTTMNYDGGAAQFVVAEIGQAPVLETNKYIMFGRVEVWLKTCAGAGVVSSFVLESDDLDEIDLEWFGSNNAEVETNFFGKGNTTTYDRATYPAMSTPQDSFHNYTIDWQPTLTNFYVDGAIVRTINYNEADTVFGINYPQTPMKVRMGNWIACPNAAAVTGALAGTCSWAGPGFYDGGKYTMSVANVTIEDYGCGGDYVYGDKSGDWKSITSNACPGVAGAQGKGTVVVSSSSVSSSATMSSSASGSASTGSSSTGSGTGSKTASSNSTATTATGKTSSTATTGTGSGSGSGSTGTKTSSTSAGAATQTTSSGNVLKPKNKYGFIDVAVMVLGLGIGYLVM